MAKKVKKFKDQYTEEELAKMTPEKIEKINEAKQARYWANYNPEVTPEPEKKEVSKKSGKKQVKA